MISALESHEYDPNPFDLIVSKVKPRLNLVEACRGATCKCSFNLRLGVKSQSRTVIAGSN